MSGYVYQEYPKTLYRTEADGTRRERLFRSAEEVEPGWTDLAGAPVEPASPKETPRLYHELLSENTRMLDTIKFLTDENAAKDRQIAALEKALNASEAMSAAPKGEAPAPKPARRRKPRSED